MNRVNRDEVRELFSQIEGRRMERGSEPSPHRPLLLLYALVECLKGEPREIPFSQINSDLSALLKIVFPERTTHNPEIPFWALQGDKVWELSKRDGMEKKQGKNIPKKSELLKNDVLGGFSPAIYEALVKDHALIVELVQELLTQIPPQSREEVLSALNVDIEGVSKTDNSISSKAAFKQAEEYDNYLQDGISQSRKFTSSQRLERLKLAPRQPKRIEVIRIDYERNPDVVAHVLERAKGLCEACKQAAPFRRKKDGTPYLEVHHKILLSEGGEDTVENAIALCPNCHRRFHCGEEELG